MKTNKTNKFYTTNEVCNILGIVKNTLFNWERAGKIPKARRDPMNNYRIYTKKNIERLQSITGRK